VTTPSDTEILIEREFDAPKHLVYKAYTTPELVSRWWPGRRGVMRSCEIDLRPGGKWRYVMGAHGGAEVAFHGEFSEVVENERIATTEGLRGRASRHRAGADRRDLRGVRGSYDPVDAHARREPRGT